MYCAAWNKLLVDCVDILRLPGCFSTSIRLLLSLQLASFFMISSISSRLAEYGIDFKQTAWQTLYVARLFVTTKLGAFLLVPHQIWCFYPCKAKLALQLGHAIL
jgi:hypothetical protein